MPHKILHDTSFWTSNIFATIVGALIAIAGSLLIFFIAKSWEKQRDAEKKEQNYKSLLLGIKAEVNHILKVITELDSILTEGIASTKRLNQDYLQSSRFKIIEFDSDLDFMEILTNAYRDIDHTNGMLDRLEFSLASGNFFIGNVRASLFGVQSSIKKLKESLDKKLEQFQHEEPRHIA